VKFLRELTDSVEYDVWREPRTPNMPVDIMCHQHEGLLNCGTLEAALLAQNLAFTVMIKDVEALSDSVMASVKDKLKQQQKTKKLGSGSGFDVSNYQTFNDTTAWVKSLAATYPDLCELMTVGSSFEGREIVGLRVTGSMGTSADKPGFWMDGGLHAREWITTATVSWMLDQVLSLYSSGDASTVAMVDALDMVFGE
jgi:murein tripeptide amidase MpaA